MPKPSADQQKQLDDLQKEVDAKLDKVLNADQKKQLKEMQENFGRGGPFAFGPPGGGGGPMLKGMGGPPQKGQGGPQQKGMGGPGPGGPIMGNTLFRAYRYGPDFPGARRQVAEIGQDD